ncbi:response regulator [Spirosoma areae]
MLRPIRCILLIDDDPDDNFLHQLVIDDSGLCDQVRVAQTGRDALRYLSDPNHPEYIRPDLILTDIKLPGMTGFEFLEQYRQFDDQLKSRFGVLVLTTALTPRDAQQAPLLPDVNGYFIKPLTTDMLQTIVDQYGLALTN